MEEQIIKFVSYIFHFRHYNIKIKGSKMSKSCVFIFQKDLRIDDNRGFLYAIRNYEIVYPVFIFNFDDYNFFQREFLKKALFYLNKKLEGLNSRLFIIRSDFYSGLEKIKEIFKPEVFVINRDFSWTGEKRENILKNFCNQNNIKYKVFGENFLVDPYYIKPTKIFTPFFKLWISNIDDAIEEEKIFLRTPFSNSLSYSVFENLNEEIKIEDFEEGLKRIETFNFEGYNQSRDYLHLDGTSKLSPYINWGIISIRRLYKRVKDIPDSQYIKELCFREFWYHIRLHFPETFYLEFQEKRRGIRWENNEIFLEKFVKGETGYPIVDACVRALKKEGWLHNRGRMILASFLTKTLLIDWRIGEKFFRDYLVDYDEVLNIHNWQWSASVGADPRPMRIFNPMIQAKKFDPECKFVKKYIPELHKEECYKIHDFLRYKLNYHEPIVDFYSQRDKALKLYGLASKNK